jgi:hypothetical protein
LLRERLRDLQNKNSEVLIFTKLISIDKKFCVWYLERERDRE